MKSTWILIICLAACLLAGCQGGSTTPGGGESKDAPPVAGSQDQINAKPTVTLPEDLKSDAYYWYGLGSDKPVNYVITSGNKTLEGTQTIRLKSVENGKALYEVERSGDFGAQMGTDTISLQKEGVYVTGSTKYTIGHPNLDLPATLTPGTTWRNDGKLDMADGQKVEQALKLKVVGEKPVNTKAGSHDKALLVSQTGDYTISGVKYRIESSLWYVKDRGLVKSVITMKSVSDKKAPPQVITIQETK